MRNSVKFTHLYKQVYNYSILRDPVPPVFDSEQQKHTECRLRPATSRQTKNYIARTLYDKSLLKVEGKRLLHGT